jgi:prevent-host-death family protein
MLGGLNPRFRISLGIRELKSTLSECVREVKAGRTIVVIDHGHPVARIIPEAVSLRERVEALRRSDLATR